MRVALLFLSGARLLLAAGFWLLTPKAVVCYPFTVYRSLHRMKNKVSMHGQWSTVDGQRRDGHFDSRQPEARSILRLTF